MRTLEGLQQHKDVWFGEVPSTVDIDEFGVQFRIRPLMVRTGHFFDQAENRHFAGKLCKDLDVLDVYSNTGGWGLHALKHGASRVIFVDKQEACCVQIEENVALNGFDDRAVILCDEGKRTLEGLLNQGVRFDAVNLDPPAFAKQRKAANSALKGYQEINRLALTKPGGYLFTSSCKYHVHEERFVGPKGCGRSRSKFTDDSTRGTIRRPSHSTRSARNSLPQIVRISGLARVVVEMLPVAGMA